MYNYGAGCSARKNTGRNYFVGPKMAPPIQSYPSIRHNSLAEAALIRRIRTCKTGLQFAIFKGKIMNLNIILQIFLRNKVYHFHRIYQGENGMRFLFLLYFSSQIHTKLKV